MEKEPPHGMIPKYKGEVLLCEDSEINQHFIKAHLNRLGLDVTVANHGQEGVDLVESRAVSGQKPFDLIFMDIQMPVMDGLKASQAINELRVGTSIVALTANVTPQEQRRFASHGMAGSLCKPFTEETLLACLNQYFTPVRYEQVIVEARAAEEERQRRKLLTGFVRRNQTTYQDICAALEAGNVKLAHRLTHTLRGLAGLMGKKELQEASRIAENALAGGDAGALDEAALKAVGRELSLVLAELAPYLHDSEPRPAASWDKNRLREIFNRLEPLLQGDDAASQGFAEVLRAFPGMGELIALLEDYEFEPALAMLASLRKTLEL